MGNITTKLRAGDEVVVLAGRDVGKTGTLRKIFKSKNKAIVTGVNMVKKHTKPNPEMGVTGGISRTRIINRSIQSSHMEHKHKAKDKISYSKDKDGKKVRLFKSSKKRLNNVN